MVKYSPRDWFQLIFHTYSRQVVRVLFPAILTMGLYTLLVCYLVVDYFDLHFKSVTAVHSLLGIVLGLFLVFRTNSAYDRWWEGRKLWGTLVNDTRSLAAKVDAFLPKENNEDRDFFRRIIPSMVIAMRDHLRHGVNVENLYLTEEEFDQSIHHRDHIPMALINLIYQKFSGLMQQGVINGYHLLVVDKETKSFADIIGACERIKNTPIPYSYSMYIKKFIFTFTITLPFAFVTEIEYWTIPIVLFIFFILVSIELIAEEIEDPFGDDVNDLPLDEITFKIHKNVKEIIQVPQQAHFKKANKVV
jgi:ion channel-forming bestrophin family protein